MPLLFSGTNSDVNKAKDLAGKAKTQTFWLYAVSTQLSGKNQDLFST